jgi:serine/threonine protein kinase
VLGEKFGDYEIVRLIGRGGMGAVYEGRNPAISRRAAIKVLLPEFAKVDDTVRRFLNEARAVNTINHAGVVQVSDVGTRPDGSLYLVMEYLEGQTLAERLHDRGGFLTESEVVSISWQLTGVLSAAHAKSIIHRDIKPGNIMLVPDIAAPEGERVKLLDFGIAKLDSDRGMDANTRKGEILGTATYMAPEQFQSDLPLDGQCDVYSLAVVIYRMVCGKVPFVSTSGDFGLAALHMFQQPQSLRDVAPQAATWLSDLVDSMLRKDPTKRPTMAEAGEELLAHLSFRAPPRRMSREDNWVHSVDLVMEAEDENSSLFAPTTGPADLPEVAPSPPPTFWQKQLARLRKEWAERRPIVIAALVAGAVVLASVVFLAVRTAKPHPPTVNVEKSPTGDPTPRPAPSPPANGTTGATGSPDPAGQNGDPSGDNKGALDTRPATPTKPKSDGKRKRFKIIN